MPNFSGKWTLAEQAQGIAAGTWTGLPQYELYSWGYGYAGRLGHNDTISRSSPVQVGATTTWYQIAAGASNSLAIKTDGTMWSWGSNDSGRLGLNDIVYRSSPVQIGALTTWSQISAGGNFNLAIKTDGTMWSWGDDGFGRLGLNQPDTDQSSPVQIGALTTWSQVSAGGGHSLAIKTDGTMWSWGRGLNGRLGLDDTINKSSPTQIGALTTWSQIAAGSTGHSLAVKTDGTLWSWGEGGGGPLGLNDQVYHSSPVQVGALTTWSQIAAGNTNSLAIKTDGTMWSWGVNTYGRLGHNDVIARSSPVQIGALTTWSQIAAGNAHSLAIKTDGTLWSWGYGVQGRLGLNDTANRSSPVQVGALTTWSQLPKMSTATHSLAINQSTT
jgi:alpha-tubulin suppressor-like RCC1 family protein